MSHDIDLGIDATCMNTKDSYCCCVSKPSLRSYNEHVYTHFKITWVKDKSDNNYMQISSSWVMKLSAVWNAMLFYGLHGTVWFLINVMQMSKLIKRTAYYLHITDFFRGGGLATGTRLKGQVKTSNPCKRHWTRRILYLFFHLLHIKI